MLSEPPAGDHRLLDGAVDSESKSVVSGSTRTKQEAELLESYYLVLVASAIHVAEELGLRVKSVGYVPCSVRPSSVPRASRPPCAPSTQQSLRLVCGFTSFRRT
jgi:hypothetical protein